MKTKWDLKSSLIQSLSCGGLFGLWQNNVYAGVFMFILILTLIVLFGE